MENFSRKPHKAKKNESGQKELAVPTAFPLASNITIIFSLIQQLQKNLFPFCRSSQKTFFILIYVLFFRRVQHSLENH